ncbi:MAG: plasmid pRiA4b ORF-3 family protein [Deltaproteobacteria bacterium]|jgi:hypothetical protein|nr:plasmid pRiA4b ORF-3 family protein [Deltaproteobacteria bacterium]
MLIHATKKLADKLKIKTPEPPEQFDELLSWRANYVCKSRTSFVFFMNDATRFVVCVNGVKTHDLKKLPELFLQVLKDEMLSFFINQEVIDKYIAEIGDFEYVRNSERSKTGWLNNAADFISYLLNSTHDSPAVSANASSALVTSPKDNQKYIRPYRDFMAALGERYGLPVRKGTAFDLTVTLALDYRKALRKLRVPANITFPQLHIVLQRAFGWRGCHMHSFGMFGKLSKKYGHRPEIELVPDAEMERDYNSAATDENGVKLSEYVPRYRKILYTYDYGDSWQHFIEVDAVIEDCEDELPVLLSGEGDAPPEDVGGTEGFNDFLRVIADPNDDEYEDTVAWSKDQFWRRFEFDDFAREVKHSLHW